MAFDLGSLSPYTEEPARVIYKMIAKGNTSKYMQIQPRIKSAETINIFATEGYWQSGSSCGFSASGDTVATQRIITVAPIKINLKWCMKDLEAYYTQKGLPKGSSYTELAFREDILAEIAQKINYRTDRAIWRGDTTSGDPYINKFDGLIEIINDASNEIEATPVAWSVTNSRTALQNVYASMTDDMLADANNVKVFMGLSEARDYRMKLGIDNLYHMTGAESKLYLENTDIEIVPVLGLSGTKKIYAANVNNLYLGVDLANEQEKFDLFYAKEADEVRFVAEFKMGVQVAFPDQIVEQVNT
jgi:hypothetical protein